MKIEFTKKEYDFVKGVLEKAELTTDIFGMNETNMSMLLNEDKLIMWLKNQSVYQKIKSLTPGTLQSGKANKIVIKKIKSLNIPKGIFIKH